MIERAIPQDHAVDKELREIILGMRADGWMIPDIASACDVPQSVVSKVLEVWGDKKPVYVPTRKERRTQEAMQKMRQYPVSETRRRILELVVDQKMRPKRAAEMLGLRENGVHRHLTDAVRRGDIVRVGMGIYEWPSNLRKTVGPEADDPGQPLAQKATRKPKLKPKADPKPEKVAVASIDPSSSLSLEGMEILAPAIGVRGEPILRIRPQEVRLTAALMREFGDQTRVILGLPAPGTLVLIPTSSEDARSWRLTKSRSSPSTVFGGASLVKRLAERGFPPGEYLARVEQGRVIVRAEDKVVSTQERRAG